MKAMIFAAGLGTRLRPLTNDRPKALVEVGGRTLLEWAIRRLAAAGVDEIIVNVHYFAEKIVTFLEGKKYFGLRIAISDETGELLETGGGLLKARGFFEKEARDFFVFNADILTDFDLRRLYDAHLHSNALATLLTARRASSRQLLFDEQGLLHGWVNSSEGIARVRRPSVHDLHFRAFSGVQVLSPRIFGAMRQQGKFSIIDTYLDCAAAHDIRSFDLGGAAWLDVGKPESIPLAEAILAKKGSAW
jgi:MurNAc alpha-1-phosphate uridylyltransferase